MSWCAFFHCSLYSFLNFRFFQVFLPDRPGCIRTIFCSDCRLCGVQTVITAAFLRLLKVPDVDLCMLEYATPKFPHICSPYCSFLQFLYARAYVRFSEVLVPKLRLTKLGFTRSKPLSPQWGF